MTPLLSQNVSLGSCYKGESEIKQDQQSDKELSEGGPWTNNPAKCITRSCYQPVLPPLMVMIHDEFCRFVGCKSEKEIKLQLTLCSFFLSFSNDFCVTYVKPDVSNVLLSSIYILATLNLKPSLMLHLAPEVSVNLCKSQHRGFSEGRPLVVFIDLFKSTSA